MWVSEVWGQGCDVTCPLGFGCMTWSWIDLPHVLKGSGNKVVFLDLGTWLQTYRSITLTTEFPGLSFLHRGKRSFSPYTQEVLCNVWLFSLSPFFQLGFVMCSTHFPLSLSLSSSFLPLTLYNAPARQGDILQTAKKCYSLHSLISFSSPSIYPHVKVSTQNEQHFPSLLLKTI